jgi:cytidylate kinase
MNQTSGEAFGLPPRHIALNGDLGSGKSAVAESVSELLGLSTISTGAIQRQIAAELNLSTLETNLLAERDREIDKRVDSVTQGLGRDSQEAIIFDSRMAWYMLENVFKVRLLVDPSVAVSRILGRGSTNEESYRDAVHAEDEVRRRYESEVRRFLARYGVDVSALKHFDLVVDTSDLSIKQVTQLVIDGYRQEKQRRVIASPRRMIPARLEDNWNTDHEVVQVVYSRPFFVVIGGLSKWEEEIANGTGGIDVDVVAEGLEEALPAVTAADYVRDRIVMKELRAWAEDHNLEEIVSSYTNWMARVEQHGSIM